MERMISALGLLVMLFLAWLLSRQRKNVNLRLVVTGVVMQLALAMLVLWTTPGQLVFEAARIGVAKIISFSDSGAQFVFGPGFREHFFAFSVLPTILFVSTLTAVLFHCGVLQWVVGWMARVMVWVMDVSGAESLAAAANVFVGQTEAPLVIKPYLDSMTKSELMAMMTGGMATVSGGVMAAYAALGADAGHLLAASIMSAPASLVMAKVIFPETQVSPTKGRVTVQIARQDQNVLDAACRGASEGLKLALNIAAMLIAFIALIALANGGLSLLPDVWGAPLTLERLLGWLLSPVAWLLGVEWQDAQAVGMLLGKKTILNEFLAYTDLVQMKSQISQRSFSIATYALCGFANFASIAIQIGGIGSLVPSRRADFAQLGFRAMLGGSLAAYMTACVAGILL